MAATLDILDDAEAARAALGVDNPGDHSAEIERMSSAVSRRIDDLCGPVVQRTVTEYHHGGTGTIWPYQAPVESVTTLTAWDGSASTVYTEQTFGTAAPSSGFMVLDGRRIIRSGGLAFPSGSATVELVYVAGRYADTAAVDPLFKEAAAAIMRRLWKREGPIWAQSSDLLANLNDTGGTPSPFFKAIDPMVAEFLGAELLPPAVA